MAYGEGRAGGPLDRLVNALRRLPGVGVKSAQRMAYHLLQNDRDGALEIAQALAHALTEVRHCERCHTFSIEPLCGICSDPKRDRRLLCVVETPADLAALERSGSYRGLYYVLMGRLSPLDGIGARDLGLQAVADRAGDGEVQEVILATNFTAEGEATSHVLGELLASLKLKVTRLARGVPAGSELEHVDLSTIAHALVDRR